MAGMARRLLGVEIVPQAVENARENARLNGIENAEFFCGDAGEAARMLAERGERPGVIVLDPPRKGCSPDLVRTVAEFGPKRIVYVSCDPATLARDLKLFAELGYPPVEAMPVDMFPGTAHVETVALLEHPGQNRDR
jgi:23S rRNA (uracil1939-C5)-methyltransferase